MNLWQWISSRWSRRTARLHAYAAGYFWLPCPICGECFSGAEWATHEKYSSIPKDDQSACGVCPKSSCMAEAKRRTLRYRALRMNGVKIEAALQLSRFADDVFSVPIESACDERWYPWVFGRMPEGAVVCVDESGDAP